QAAMARAAVEETAQRREEFRLLEQERVVTLVGLDLNEADIRRDRVERVNDGAALPRRIEPVAGERDQTEPRRRAAERISEGAVMLRRKVEIIAGAGDVEIRVGVEAVDENVALMAQIALDLKVGVEAVSNFAPVLQIAAELAVQRRLGQISDMRRHARDAEAALRPTARGVVIAILPVRVGHDRLASDLVKRDVLRRMACGAGD